MALLVRVLVSEGVIFCGRPQGCSRRSQGGRNRRRVQEGSLCGSETARSPLCGETEAASHSPPLGLVVASPSLEEGESDIGPQFGEVCFSAANSWDRFPSGRGSTWVGALIGVFERPGFLFLSVTDIQCDLGQVTFGPQCPDGKNEDVNLQFLRFPRFSGFVSDIRKTILNCTVKWNTVTGYEIESWLKNGLMLCRAQWMAHQRCSINV